MKKRNTPILLLLIFGLLVLSPLAAMAQEENEPACSFLLAQGEASSSAEMPLFSPEPAMAASCGFCSFSGCVGATEGRACTTFGGAAGQCYITGKICGGGSLHCGCYP